MKNRWKSAICAVASAALLCTQAYVPVMADEAVTEGAGEVQEAARTEALAEAASTEAQAGKPELEGQLTLEDIDRISQGSAKVYTHDDKVTLVDGSCTDQSITDMDAARAVVDSMITLIGGDDTTSFDPWSVFTDTAGNVYYVFHQTYGDSTVPGGAVKVVTDADGNMIALSSSVESELPDAASKEGITKEEAERIVREYADGKGWTDLPVMDEWTQEIILPNMIKVDIMSEDSGARYVWAVYTHNPGEGAYWKSDLPYLAHYVTMSGEYLYNLPTITPGDSAGSTGFDTDYVFEFMEPASYTGYVDLSDGSETKVTVDVMRDKRTGMYYLGNLERKIVVADCYEFLYNDGRVVLEYSPDNREWDQVGLMSLYNYCRAWDYYNEIGWIGGDNEGTPILILNNFCDFDHLSIDNACYCGKMLGWQLFAASQANDFSQNIDVIAHEFTHCVTQTTMTYNAYVNDYGAINEAMSDIQGQFCKMSVIGADQTKWIMGEQSVVPVRSMKDPHMFEQPEYVWDLYYVGAVKTPTAITDQGGVHTNSSLLNNIAYRLYEEGGMSIEEARAFWFAVDSMMVPKTDYVQLSEILPVVLKNLGMEQYEGALTKAIEDTRIADTSMPEQFGKHQALIRMTLPDNEVMTDGNWVLQILTVNFDLLKEKFEEYAKYMETGDISFLPPLTRQLFEDLIEDAGGKEKLMQTEKQQSLGEILVETGLDIVDVVLSNLTEEDQTAETETRPTETPATEAPKPDVPMEVKEEFQNWVREEFKGLLAMSNGSAGQDDRTIETVCSAGYTIPVLMHIHVLENSMTQADQFVQMAMIAGHWYDISSVNSLMLAAGGGEADSSSEDQQSIFESPLFLELMGNLLPKLEQIKSLKDLPSLFVVNLKEGEVNELPTDGLENITLPDAPPSNVTNAEPVTPGPKSRPAEEQAGTEITDTAETEAEISETTVDAAETEAAEIETEGLEEAA